MAINTSRPRDAQPPLRLNQLVVVTSSVLASAAAHGIDSMPADVSGMLDEVIVTAQKRAENLQIVPISIQSLDNRRLEQLQITSLEGYTKYLSSVTLQYNGPSQSQLYVRGVTNGGDGAPFGSQPLVGVYLDETPVTTIGVSLDVHIYDIARIEALSGPQGTLFGSSSMAGTVRIVTNKPDAARFEAGYDVTGNAYTKGDVGGKFEGFVNVPLSDHAAIRLVGFAEHDGGYINNVLAPDQVYPTSGIPRSNAALVRKNFNSVDTSGGRAALKVDLNDRWTITPGVIAQQQVARGVPYFEPSSGDLNVLQFLPNKNTDSWWQATLTVEGRISDFDVVYAGGVLRRHSENTADYTQYTYYYDSYYHTAFVGSTYATYFGDNFRDNSGKLIAPVQNNIQTRHFTKQSHELRVSTPKDWRLRGVVGAFLQRQADDYRGAYSVPGLADIYSISNQPGVWYLNDLPRTDRDRALYTDWSFDLAPALTLSAGIRGFGYDNTVYGFFGWNGQPTYDGFTHGAGEKLCFPGTQTTGTRWPCVNVDQRATKRGETHRANLTYKINPDAMLYTTWSTGFRPGGINRLHTRPGYDPDYLTNFEAGWKSEWLGRRLRFNGAVFLERWKDAQFSVLGPNQTEELLNAGSAEIKGIESDVTWLATGKLTVSAALTALEAKLTSNACLYASPSLSCTEPSVISNPDGGSQTFTNSVIAPSGTRLPLSAKLKGNLTARYQFAVSGFDAHLQGAVVAQSDVRPALQSKYQALVGLQPGYASFDFSGGIRLGRWSTELFVQNAFDRRAEYARYALCVFNASAGCLQRQVLPIPPRLVGLTIGQKF